MGVIPSLPLRHFQILGALMHLGFEQDAVEASFEQVADAQQQLDLVQRLGQEIAGALLQRFVLGGRNGIGGEDQDGNRVAIDILMQHPHDGKAIQVRHREV